MNLRPSMKSSTAEAMVRFLLYAHAAVWILFGLITAVNGIGGLEDGAVFSVVGTVLMFINGALYGWAGYRIGAKKTYVYLLTLALLIVNLFGTLTDQLGLFDGLVLILSLTALILLVVKRKTFVPAPEPDSELGDEETDRPPDTE